jgi:hypothetical protein
MLSKHLIINSRGVLQPPLNKHVAERISNKIVDLLVSYAKAQGSSLEIAQSRTDGAIRDGGNTVSKAAISELQKDRSYNEAVKAAVSTAAIVQIFRKGLNLSQDEAKKSICAFLSAPILGDKQKTALPTCQNQYVEGISKSYLYTIISEDSRLSHRLECTKLSELDYTIPFNGGIGASIIIGIGAAFFGGPSMGAAVIGGLLVFWALAAQQLEQRKLILDREITKFAQAIDDINTGRNHSHSIERSNNLLTVIVNDTSEPGNGPILPSQLAISGNHWGMELSTAERLGILF